jgi:hypothetical protein
MQVSYSIDQSQLADVLMFALMTAITFDLDTPLGQRRAIIRRDSKGAEIIGR